MLLNSLARRAVLGRLARITRGRLTLRDGNATIALGPGGDQTTTLHVHDRRFYRALALGGHLGAVEAYLDGWWTADDLTALVRLFVQNGEVLQRLEEGTAGLLRPLRRALHALRRNTRDGSRRNIRAHYDLGNDFFAEFLDPTLTYSCAVFERPDASLEEAQLAKYDRICRLLELSPEDHLLEIGTGWGGFAQYAAGRYGCRVTTTTISAAQHGLAVKRVAAAGLADRVEVLLADYRDLGGTYDKLASIEMIEAVGHAYYRTFFQTCAERLKPGGRMALQAITIDPSQYDRAAGEVDFIKRYIFPGSNIPSVPVLEEAARRPAGLALVRLDDITPHYAETLRRWRENFLGHWERIRRLGFSEEFRRLWEFYFCYCEGGFRERYLGDVQMLFIRPETT